MIFCCCELCADNSFLYVASLAAGVRLANATGDSAHAREWQAALVRGVKAIDTHLWLSNAGYSYYQGVYLLRSILVQQPVRFKLCGRPVLSAHLNVETAGSEPKRPEI
jgi:hypothetical protein